MLSGAARPHFAVAQDDDRLGGMADGGVSVSSVLVLWKLVRSLNFWTLPDGVRGRSTTAWIDSGHFCLARPASAR